MKAFQLALLSGKKTFFKPKEPTVRLVKRRVWIYPEECSDSVETITYIPMLIHRKPKDDSIPLSGKGWHNIDLYGNKATESTKPSDGNVVVGLSTSCKLTLDVDYQSEETVLEFAPEYAKFHKLGSSLVLKTSDGYRTDLFGNKLGKYCIVFGKKPLSWEEIRWHIKEARRLGMIEKTVVIMTRFGDITERVNAKNDKTPPPKILKFFARGDMRGIRDYVRFWNINKR